MSTKSKYRAFPGKDEDEGGEELGQGGYRRVPVGGLICHPKRISPWLHLYLLSFLVISPHALLLFNKFGSMEERERDREAA